MKKLLFLFLLVFLAACSEVKVVDISKGENVEPIVLELNETEKETVETQPVETQITEINNSVESNETEEADSITTKKPELIILISDDAPMSDILWATDLAQEIQFTALENKKISKRFSYKSGFSRMYSEITGLNELSGRVSLVLYNGNAVDVIGAHNADDDGDYQEMADYLADLTNAQKVITSEDVKSKDFKGLFWPKGF